VRKKRVFATVSVVGVMLVSMSIVGPSQADPAGRFAFQAQPGRPTLSGVADPTFLTGTEGATDSSAVARGQAAASSDDIQANGDNKARLTQRFGSGEGLPANETSIAINPTDQRNVIGGTNDYEPGVDSVMGIYTSFNGGHTWPYSRHARQIITPSRKMLGSGDPVIAFDREGVAYASFIAFGRDDCDSYIAVIRSEDKGVTWTVPVDSASEGTKLQVGDGITVHNGGPEDCQIFHDKEWMTAGPRPDGVPLVEGTDPAHTSADRLYVTWTRFDSGPAGDTSVDSPIYLAYSDDQGRHWSSAQEISGSNEESCQPQFGDTDAPACDENQFSVPVVDPRDGTLHVAFQNFNVECCEFSQYLIVRSDDGGQTFSDPVRITEVADGADKYPICADRQTLDDMCARVNAAGNIDIDPRNGALYIAFADNRNGTAEDTNTDVLVSKSTDGGATWSPIQQVTTSEDDQFYPWLSVAPNGIVAVAYFDRQYGHPLIDTSLAVSTNAAAAWSLRRVSDVSWDPDLAFRLGVFIGDYNGLDTTRRTAIPFWTDARFAEPNVEGNNPPHQQSDAMVDLERLRRRG
jgi:hypothetical protein